MRLLTNPVVLRMILVLIAAGFSLLMATIIMRRLRRGLLAEASLPEDCSSPETFSLHTYNAVIQQLKQQKHELQSSRQSEIRRAKTWENISTAVLSNLSSGVIFFTCNGLVRQSNAASKQILGFASPVGMTAAQLFRQALVLSSPNITSLADAVEASLRDRTPSGHLQAEYVTPSGEQRILDVTVTPVHSTAGDSLGSACLINDQTEMATIRKQQEIRGELCAEMALELRNSLNTISGYARQLAAGNDAELTRRIAGDIVSEASHLGHTIGSFLVESTAAKAGKA